MHVFFIPDRKQRWCKFHMSLCLLMAISASLTNNLTIGLLFWAKQKKTSSEQSPKRKEKITLDKAKQDRFVVEKHD